MPKDFEVPTKLEGTGYRLEPLGPEHNERDYQAWTSSTEHIAATPGFAGWGWPSPMSIEENLADLEMHARDFANRKGFTYSILDGDVVVGCLYIYPSQDEAYDASVRSWVTKTRADLDIVVWREVSEWLEHSWPFSSVAYAARV